MEEHPPTLGALRPEADGDPLDLYRDAARRSPAGRPWVMSNFVAGLDGSIAVDGHARGLSSPTDRAVFRLLRSLADVVLVGAGTFRTERYGPARLAESLRAERQARGQPPVPTIAVVSRSLQLDLTAPFFTGSEARPTVITSEASDPDARRRTEHVADVIVAGEQHVDLPRVLAELQARGAQLVLCEGGPHLHADLLANGLVDELCLTVSPMLGGDPSRIVADEPRGELTAPRLAHVLAAGDELFLRYVL